MARGISIRRPRSSICTRYLRALSVAIALCALVSSVSAQGAPKISIADSIRTTAPGSAVSFMFMIESPGGAGGAVVVSMPQGLRAMTPGVELPPGSPRVSFLVAAGVPSTTRAGRYRIEVSVSHTGRQVKAGAWVEVVEQHALIFSKLNSPDLVVAGSRISARYVLANAGNTDVKVRLRITSPNFSLTDSALIYLGPGASKEIPIEIVTDAGTGTTTNHLTAISAEVVGKPRVVASASFRTIVAPQESSAPAPVHAIVSGLRMIGTSSELGSSGAEIFGAGSWRDGSLTRIEYVARTIAGAGSVYGDRAEYRLLVAAPNFTIVAGDQVNRLSALSENGRYAKGIRAEVASNGWKVGGFFNRDAGTLSPREQMAVFLNRDFGNGVLLDVNFLDKREALGGTMLTAKAQVRSLPIGTVEAEVGHAINSVDAQAWMVSAHGQFKSFAYNVYRQLANANYPGATRGTSIMNASVNMTPLKGIGLTASSRDHRAAQEPLRPGLTPSRNWNRSAGIKVADLLTVDFMRNGVDGGWFSSRGARVEDLATARVSGRVAGVSLRAAGGWGTLAVEGSNPQKLARYSAAATLRNRTGAAISVSAETLRGGTVHVPRQTAEHRAGIDASLALRGGSRFSVSAYAGERWMPERSADATFEATWDQKLPAGHNLSLRARFHRNPLFDSPSDNILRAEYTIPFGLPVGASRSRSRVNGRIFDAATGAGIQGAVVLLGALVAVTDARGRFAFATADEGSLSLNLGGSTATAGWIPVLNLPLSITPRLGRTSSYDIAMTRAASLRGKVRLFVSSPPTGTGEGLPPAEDPNGLRGARVALTRAEETRHATSGSMGEFTLTDLRPGTWTLRVDPKDIPLYSYVAGDSVVVNVGPGREATVELTVLPRKRKITIVQVGLSER